MSDDPAKHAFGERMCQGLVNSGMSDATFDPAAFVIRTPHGIAHLGPLWASLQSVDIGLVDLLQLRWLESVLSVPVPDPDPDVARSHLRVRTSSRARHTRLALEGRLLDRPYASVGRHLTGGVVVDVVYAEVGARPAPVHPSMFATWGLDHDGAFDEAIARRIADGVSFEARGRGWYTAGPASGLGALMLAWRSATTRDQVAELVGLPLPSPAFVALLDEVIYAFDPHDAEACTAVAASISRVVAQSEEEQEWLMVDGLLPSEEGLTPVPLPVTPATRHEVRLAQHRMAYGSADTVKLLEAVYGGHQGDLQLTPEGLRAVPIGYPALLGEAEVVVDGAGAERGFDAVHEAGELVNGLWPPIWRLARPVLARKGNSGDDRP